MNKQMEQTLKKYAKQDLKIAKTKGSVVVTQTKVGNVEIKMTQGVLFQFINFNTGKDINGAHALTEKEAVEFLVNNYQVVA